MHHRTAIYTQTPPPDWQQPSGPTHFEVGDVSHAVGALHAAAYKDSDGRPVVRVATRVGEPVKNAVQDLHVALDTVRAAAAVGWSDDMAPGHPLVAVTPGGVFHAYAAAPVALIVAGPNAGITPASLDAATRAAYLGALTGPGD